MLLQISLSRESADVRCPKSRGGRSPS
jgi:hypothetical protein